MKENKVALTFVTIAAILVLLCGAFFTMGGIVNTRSTIPSGWYWKVDKPLGIGKTIVFCPPNRPEFQAALNRGIIDPGSCPDGYDSIMLKVAAKFKNRVTINADGVYVNDVLYPNSKPLAQDREGHPIYVSALENYELKEDEILLMSYFDGNAFDSRYFGLVDVDQVDSVINPVLQW